jgi:hypothetical protein
MFENSLDPFQNAGMSDRCSAENISARQYNAALDRFQSMLRKGIVSRLIRKVLRRPRSLYDLNEVRHHLALCGSCYAGIQVVRISAIIGSEGRTADFDMDFHPLHKASQERWVNMAVVHLTRLPLPPIELIQVGNAYFVRDGHHRISVGRAFGQIAMDAEVLTWKAAPPFPWQSNRQQESSTFCGQRLISEKE